MLFGLCSFKVKNIRQNISRNIARENCQFNAGKNDSVEFSITIPIHYVSYECWQFCQEIGFILPTGHCAPLGLVCLQSFVFRFGSYDLAKGKVGSFSVLNMSTEYQNLA